MKILYVNDNDLAGRRFNGYDLQQMLNGEGHQAKQLVMAKASTDENVVSIVDTPAGYFIREQCKAMEKRTSLQSVFYPFGLHIKEMKEFKEAELVHYHLIFNHFLSLYTFKELAQSKPTVWTLHDPWALTGHCVHPVDCEGWRTGCKGCPYLDRYSPLEEDNAHTIWNLKKETYKQVDVDIVVASPWMLDLVKRSPLTAHFKNVHLIPFGIDLKIFKQRRNRKEIRQRYGIPKENFVIMFRQDDQEWKGLPYIREMLRKLEASKPITLLTVGRTGLLEEFKNNYQVIEYDWVNDNELLVDLYSSADLFLMPSIAEAFGMMAIESMACSLPVIVFEGTALPSVTFAPEFGVCLRKGDTEAFVEAVSKFINSPEECRKKGRIGRELAERHYSISGYNEKMLNLYKEILTREK